MKLILGHIDDRFAPEMTVVIEDDLGKIIKYRHGYSPYDKIADDVAINALEMLKELSIMPSEKVDIVVQRGSQAFYNKHVSENIADQVKNYQNSLVSK